MKADKDILAVSTAKSCRPHDSSESLTEAFAKQDSKALAEALTRNQKDFQHALARKRSKKEIEFVKRMDARRSRPKIRGPPSGLELRIQISKTKYLTLPADKAHLYAKIKGDIWPGQTADRYIPASPGGNPPPSTISRRKITTGKIRSKNPYPGQDKMAIGENKHEIKGEKTGQKGEGGI